MPRLSRQEQEERALRRRVLAVGSEGEAVATLSAASFQERSLLLETMPAALMTERFVRALHDQESWTSLTRHWLMNPALGKEAAALSFRVVAEQLAREIKPRDLAHITWHLREMERVAGPQPEALDPLVAVIFQRRAPWAAERAISPVRLGGLLLELKSLRRRHATRLVRLGESRRSALLQGAVANPAGERAVLNYMRHPRISQEFLREAADFSPLRGSQREMLRIPRIREDPVCLEALLSHCTARELQELLREGERGESFWALSLLARKDPALAAAELRSLPPERALSHAELLLLLSHESSELRLAAMLALRPGEERGARAPGRAVPTAPSRG